MQAHSTAVSPRHSAESVRRRGRRGRTAAAALLGVGMLIVAAGTADAETRNPCSDLRHQGDAHLDIAANFLALAVVFGNLGLTNLATEHVDMGNYFVDAAMAYYGDHASCVGR